MANRGIPVASAKTGGAGKRSENEAVKCGVPYGADVRRESQFHDTQRGEQTLQCLWLDEKYASIALAHGFCLDTVVAGKRQVDNAPLRWGEAG